MTNWTQRRILILSLFAHLERARRNSSDESSIIYLNYSESANLWVKYVRQGVWKGPYLRGAHQICIGRRKQLNLEIIVVKSNKVTYVAWGNLSVIVFMAYAILTFGCWKEEILKKMRNRPTIRGKLYVLWSVHAAEQTSCIREEECGYTRQLMIMRRFEQKGERSRVISKL